MGKKTIDFIVYSVPREEGRNFSDYLLKLCGDKSRAELNEEDMCKAFKEWGCTENVEARLFLEDENTYCIVDKESERAYEARKKGKTTLQRPLQLAHSTIN